MKNAVPNFSPSKNRREPTPAMSPTIIAITNILFVGAIKVGIETIFTSYSGNYYTPLNQK